LAQANQRTLAAVVMEDLQCPRLIPAFQTEEFKGSCDLSASVQRHDESGRGICKADGCNQFTSMEPDLEFLQSVLQWDERESPSASVPQQAPVPSDPFHHDWPHWNTPARESDAAL
jgi:hypothetical protein